MSNKITRPFRTLVTCFALSGVVAIQAIASEAPAPTKEPAPATPVIKITSLEPSLVGSVAPTPAKQTRPTKPVQATATDDPVSELQDAPARPNLDGIGPIEVVRQHYPNGRVMLEREVVQDAEGNYINHGAWKMWNPEGDMVVDGATRDGQLHGSWTRVYEGDESRLFSELPFIDYDGPFLSEAKFEDGMLHGTWTISDPDHRKIMQIEFVDGHRHGAATWWYANGKKMQQIQFRSGIADGELLHWKPDGQLVTRETYVNGRKLESTIEKFANGQKKSEISVLSPQLVLQSGDEWWAAKLAKFTIQGAAERHGPASTWYDNGQKQSQAEYDAGRMIGQHTWWYENGQKAAEGQFKTGKPHGDWTWFHRNGQKAVAGEYVDGAAIGEWIAWSAEGRLSKRIDPSRAPTGDDSETKTKIARPRQANHETR